MSMAPIPQTAPDGPRRRCGPDPLTHPLINHNPRGPSRLTPAKADTQPTLNRHHPGDPVITVRQALPATTHELTPATSHRPDLAAVVDGAKDSGPDDALA